MEGRKIDYGALRDSLGYRIRLAEIANMHSFARAFGDGGITPARLTALELIARNPGINPARLAAAMAVEPSNLVALVRHLERRGWVRAAAGANRREKSLEATAEGRAAAAALRRKLRAQDRALARGLDARERAQLVRLLERVVAGS